MNTYVVTVETRANAAMRLFREAVSNYAHSPTLEGLERAARYATDVLLTGESAEARYVLEVYNRRGHAIDGDVI